ncbi:hypothetical protein ACIPL1_27400 [Pseudomonas sp. NPDC090202]|uniref:hypothetical protein n=1 Tax=Pseudomonas sp. NPDC090202 TaxID=3364476 RepID=UPI003828E41D
MAITKDEFIQSAVNEIGDFPTLSRRYLIGDPLITQSIAAIAAMLADVSNQIDVNTGETYLKARDVTVLADAAVKGVIPFATPSIARITLQNNGSASVQVLVGRVLLDQAGRYWRVLTGTTVLAGDIGTIVAWQVALREVSHTVAQNKAFYTVDLAPPSVGYIAEVSVGGYEYTPEFCNVDAGASIYHIKSDEFQTISLMFGASGIAGRQPAVGSTLALSLYDTEGEITLNVGATFTFEYSGVGDPPVVMTLEEVTQQGAAPMDIPTMREVCDYPGIYSENAVLLSNFEHLVRKKVPQLTFLSVWNEAREESVRGGSLDNFNNLFVSAKRDGTKDDTLLAQITDVLLTADDSYGVRSVPVVEVIEPLVITLSVPSTYDAESVKQAVRSLVLSNYGRTSAWAKRGSAKILKKDLYDLFRQNVPALTQRIADVSVDSIGDGSNRLPEQFRYVTPESLQVNSVEAD